MRNWHYLHAGRAVGWPSQSIALSVVCSEPDHDTYRGTTWKPTFLGWAALAWQGTDGEAQRTDSADGIDALSFWRWLTRRTAEKGTTWLWQLSALHGFAALNGWEWCRYGIGSLCVLSDPPTLLLARTPNQRGSCLWLDMRNLSTSASWRGLSGAANAGNNGPEAGYSGLSGRLVARTRAELLQTWLVSWYQTVKALNLGGLRATAAAQAWHGWRTSYVKVPVEVHCDSERLRAESDAIYGGRNEVYTLGNALNRVYEIDATSHYPAIAGTYPLPGRIARGATGNCRDCRRAADTGLLVIARGRVRTEAPCLPNRRDGLTVYPVGTWRATYCWPEWKLAERCGARVKIERWWGYEPVECFSEYFETLYRARLAASRGGEQAHESALKLLMNSLIGKCAARARFWTDAPDEWHPEPWASWYDYDTATGTATRMRSVSGRVQREVIGDWADEAIPALAAWVYSLGRVRLWDWLQTADMDEVFYTDTDSLWTSEQGYANIRAAGLIRGKELGGLRLRKTHPWARFLGHKHYETPDGLVCAGRPGNTVFDAEDNRIAWRGERIAEACSSERTPTATLVRQEIPDRAAYRGGKIGYGGVVYPWRIDDNGQEKL